MSLPSRWLQALALLMLLGSGASSQTFQRSGGVLRLVHGERAYPVDTDTVTLGLVPGGADLPAVLAALGPSSGSLTPRRANRLGLVDLSLPSGLDPREAVQRLRATGLVAFATCNTRGSWSGDPEYADQWHLHNTGQSGGTVGADVGAEQAWALTPGSPGVVVAVIDSGVDLDHGDLTANLFAHPSEVPANGLDDDGNGFVDDVHGYDFEHDDGDPTGTFWHGTAVAGVVAAVGDNGLGGAGLAGGRGPGTGCRLLALAVGTSAPVGAVIDDAIVYAVDAGARVINLSLNVAPSPAIDAALAWADAQGVVVVAASGNHGSQVLYPADQPTVIAVASTDRHDAVSGFSNPGAEVWVAAPGEQVRTTQLGGGGATVSGTSFAAPQVAALAALMFSYNGQLTPGQVAQALADTAHDLGKAGWEPDAGFGRIDAPAALLAVDPAGQGSAEPFGEGLAGTAGEVPRISAPAGPPVVGGAAFKLKLSKARGGSAAWLALGLPSSPAPFKGGTLYVDPSLPALVLGVVTDQVFGSALGSAVLPLPVPAAPALAGLALSAQWIVADPAAPQAFALSRGMALTVGA